MTLYRDKAVVLRTYDLREADRIIVMMTESHGKVRAVANGVRKMSSRFGARLEPLSHVDILISTGKNLGTVNQVDLVTSAKGLYADLDRLTMGLAMLEAVDQLGMENEPTEHLYRMLVGALQWLSENDSSLVLAAFYFKLLVAEGVGAQVEACVGCGAPGDRLVAFDVFRGGAQCRDCRSGATISAEAIGIIQDIVGGRLNNALSLRASSATREVAALATKCMEHHLERRLKSVAVFESPEM
ncbi:MAG: DNA repair protein RecO [Actinobacteria bacterium]|nr:DNA repair protein RecO [Actinomycetota bacterium]